jgi:MoxR-like ATPase
MNALNAENVRRKALDIYAYIRDHLYLNRPDMAVNDEEFNSALLMSLLIGLSRGKALIIGEPGLGKTTSVEYVGALLHRIPLGTIWKAEVAGHPEQTEEKIIGRPDLGKLNLGEEVVVWSHFVLLPVKIVDEINRLPETKQSMILNGVDRGNWEYLNDAVINREYCLFATANYQDRGTHTIIAPLMDRFDVLVESRHPGANISGLLGANGDREMMLRHGELEAAFRDILSQCMPYQTRMRKFDALSDQFGDYLSKETDIPSLTRAERLAAYDQKNRIPFSVDFNAFLRVVISELSFCHHYGQKRSGDLCDDGCHFSGYLCGKVKNCLSNRFPKSARSLSRALAWLLGDEAVGVHHLEAVLPFVLAHRVQWRDQAVAESEKELRNDPLEIHMARNAVGEMSRRYREQPHRIQKALSIACRIVEGEPLTPVAGDHPLFHDILRDLGQKAPVGD